MTDLSTGIYAGIATKVAGLSAAAILAAIVVMAVTQPETKREFIVAMISTLVFSIGLGSGLVKYFEISDWANDFYGLCAIGSIMFVAGLPGWCIVRAFALWQSRRKNLDLAELFRDAKKSMNDPD